jgi:hypothetical protein
MPEVVIPHSWLMPLPIIANPTDAGTGTSDGVVL